MNARLRSFAGSSRAGLPCAISLLVLVAAGCGDSSTSIATPPAGFAAAGEEAFYETLNGIAVRDEQAIEWLRAATRENPREGRSWFLLGMMHLWRVAQEWTDPARPSRFVQEQVTLGREALERAVVLVPEDTRIPGFHGAARYNEGLILGDPAIAEDGLRVLRESMKLNFLFNSFDFVGVVPPSVPGDHDLMKESLDYIERGLTMLDVCTPEICGNDGHAPHNGEGTFLLFGDIYAKAGDRAKALEYYGFSDAVSSLTNWSMRPVVQERIATVDERIAAYRDGDPSNDPMIVGQGGGGCNYCHFR